MNRVTDHTLYLRTIAAHSKHVVVHDGVREVIIPRRLMKFGSRVADAGKKSRLVLPEWFVQREALDA